MGLGPNNATRALARAVPVNANIYLYLLIWLSPIYLASSDLSSGLGEGSGAGCGKLVFVVMLGIKKTFI